jgi:hypothetical protein
VTDERLRIEFEVPYTLGEVFPDRRAAPPESRKCSMCGGDSQALPADKLTVIKHRHALQPLGNMRLYCPEHAASAAEWSSGETRGRDVKHGPVCPTCFVTVPFGTRLCDTCGQEVDRR